MTTATFATQSAPKFFTIVGDIVHGSAGRGTVVGLSWHGEGRTAHRFCSAISLAASLLCSPSSATENDFSDGSWPRLLAESDVPACQDALSVAKSAFHSPAEWIFEAASEIPIGEAHILLAPAGRSGGFIVDSGLVETRLTQRGTLFRNKYSRRGRFTIRESAFNSNGDNYELFLMKTGIAPALTDDVLDQAKGGSGPDAMKIPSDPWARPWLISTKDGRWVLGIDTHAPWDFLADWRVYSDDPDQSQQPLCRIGFRPDEPEAVQLLSPGPLQDYARLADDILGPPSPNEGTLNPTGRIRSRVHNAWANLMLRPWAIHEPYNSPNEVERGLTKWSQEGDIHREQYERLKVLYPQALAALTEHYRTTLNMPQSEVESVASRLLERVLDTHFIFSKTAR